MTSKLLTLFFRCILKLMLLTNYLYFVFFTWLPIANHNNFGWIVILVFNILFIMSVWTLYVTVSSEAGQVPLYWGFYVGDSDNKRRRYCLMCNVFKPERCHHCSICNRCVLNMDHHCPWINNCIGFFNRKYFIQMLFYFNLTLLFIIIANFKFSFDAVLKIITNRINLKEDLTENLLNIFIYFLDLVALVVITLFFKFHLSLIFENKTTIETIDKKGENFESEFNLGYYKNWLQVMGENKLLWFLPLNIYIGMPLGNGVDWIEE